MQSASASAHAVRMWSAHELTDSAHESMQFIVATRHFAGWVSPCACRKRDTTSCLPIPVRTIGACVTRYMDHAEPGKSVHYPATVARNIYPIDVYRDKDQLLTAGNYGEALVLACAFGYTIPTAWDAALAVASAVRFPGRAYRFDGAGTDYPSSPLRRYEALAAMGYV